MPNLYIPLCVLYKELFIFVWFSDCLATGFSRFFLDLINRMKKGLWIIILLRSKTVEGVSLVQVDPGTEYFYYKTIFPFEESSVPSFVDNASFAEVFI